MYQFHLIESNKALCALLDVMSLFVNYDRHTSLWSQECLFIIFLKSLDEIVVYFSSKGALDILVFYLMTEGN